MTDYPVDNALTVTKSSFNIDLLNKVTGTTYPQAAVCGANTLGQVLKEYAADIGVNPNDSKVLFENKRTGTSTSEPSMTVEGFDLRAGDVLAISDNAGVAADEKAFDIDLLNKVTGATYPQAAVCGANTLGQVLKEYAADIGVNPNDNKVLFENKRTGTSTSEISMTVERFDLRAGDVLAISDNAGVAGDEKAFEIELLREVTGVTCPHVAVYGVNTLKVLFENKRTGTSTSDIRVTIEGFDLRAGDVLAISDNAGVAADEKTFEIELLHKVTGATCPHVAVYGANTLGQVLWEYAADIGVNPNDSRVRFENRRTGISTSDRYETVEGFALHAGDVLVISDNAAA